MRAYRSERYLDWLRERHRRCQRSGNEGVEQAHPPRRRPWIGEVEPGRFSPGTEKASDYGALMLSRTVHTAEHASKSIGADKVWGSGARIIPKRDVVAVSNMVEYAEHLDPGSNLWAEMVEWAQARIVEMEGHPEPAEPIHPVDALIDISNRVGHTFSDEFIQKMREYCDTIVGTEGVDGNDE